MKSTLLLVTALIFSAASFGQTQHSKKSDLTAAQQKAALMSKMKHDTTVAASPAPAPAGPKMFFVEMSQPEIADLFSALRTSNKYTSYEVGKYIDDLWGRFHEVKPPAADTTKKK